MISVYGLGVRLPSNCELSIILNQRERAIKLHNCRTHIRRVTGDLSELDFANVKSFGLSLSISTAFMRAFVVCARCESTSVGGTCQRSRKATSTRSRSVNQIWQYPYVITQRNAYKLR